MGVFPNFEVFDPVVMSKKLRKKFNFSHACLVNWKGNRRLAVLQIFVLFHLILKIISLNKKSMVLLPFIVCMAFYFSQNIFIFKWILYVNIANICLSYKDGPLPILSHALHIALLSTAIIQILITAKITGAAKSILTTRVKS